MILDANGAALAGCRIAADVEDDDAVRGPLFTNSDATGAFAIDALCGTRYRLQAWLPAGGIAIDFGAPIVVEAGGEPLRLVVPDSQRATGRVALRLRASGEPPASMRIDMTGPRGRTSVALHRDAALEVWRSDPLQPGSYHATLIVQGPTPAFDLGDVVVVANATTDLGDVAPPQPAVVRVVAPWPRDVEPRRDAFVRADGLPPHEAQVGGAILDPRTGTATLRLAAGRYRVTVQAKGMHGDPVDIDVASGEERELPIELLRSSVVVLRLPGGEERAVYEIAGASGQVVMQSILTAERREAERSVTLTAGSYTLRVEGDSGRRRRATLAVVDTAPARWEPELQPIR